MSIALVAQAGCKEDPPPPTAEPATSSSAGARAKLPMRSPTSPMPKVDPQAMKEYRVDVCYFGTLTLKQARDAYFASLGKDEPSEKKLPSFGAPATPAAAGTGGPKVGPGKTGELRTPPTTAGAKAATTGAPAAKPATAAAKPTPPGAKPPAAAPKPAETSKAAAAAPGTSAKAAAAGAPSDVRPDARRPFDIAMRAPHDRNARGCTVAAGLKDFAMPEVDEALTAFAPFAVELARDINAASMYYQREEFKNDEFKKGKEYHKKLVAQFEKLDEHSDKLGAAIVKWRKEHQPDATKLDEGQKLSITAYDDAREILLGVLPKKVDMAAHNERVAKLAKSIEALRTFGATNAADPWPKFLLPSLDAYVKAVKEAEGKITEKGVTQDAFLNLVTGYTSVIEANYRALSRSLVAKGQVMEHRMRPIMPPMTAAPGAPPTPAPAPEPEKAPE
jgi:hypothetical protein